MSMHLQLFDTGTLQAYAVQGSIFEEKSVDVLAFFQYYGCAKLPIDLLRYMDEQRYEFAEKVFTPCEGKQGDVKDWYFVDSHKSVVDEAEANDMIWDFLDAVAKKGYSSIAMNGIRTDGDSEYDNVRAIREWAVAHPGSSIKTVLLVDLRGGFNKLAKAQPPK